MNLLVPLKYNSNGFISFLKSRIKGYIAFLFNESKCIKIDEYFLTDEFRAEYGDFNINCRKIILLAMNNIESKVLVDGVNIYINEDIYYPLTNIKLIELCKLINYGNMSVEGYPIFTNTFNHFSKDIKKYKEKFLNGMGV